MLISTQLKKTIKMSNDFNHCVCEHEVQDKMHGDGMRVHNYREKAEVWRCTVCARERSK